MLFATQWCSGGLRVEPSPGLGNLLRCTVMLADIAEWPAFNAVYAEFFTDLPMPARSAFGCNGLALGARVEIECTAAR